MYRFWYKVRIVEVLDIVSFDPFPDELGLCRLGIVTVIDGLLASSDSDEQAGVLLRGALISAVVLLLRLAKLRLFTVLFVLFPFMRRLQGQQILVETVRHGHTGKAIVCSGLRNYLVPRFSSGKHPVYSDESGLIRHITSKSGTQLSSRLA
jgi:uncharacterized membrane protein